MQTESGYVHSAEDIGYRVHRSLPLWTNKQNIWTFEQLSSIANTIVYCMEFHARLKGVVMGKVEGKVAVITGGRIPTCTEQRR